MLLRLTQIRLFLHEEEPLLKEKAADYLKIEPEEILSLEIVRKSLDSRQKNKINYVYTLKIELADDADLNIDANDVHVKIIEESEALQFSKLKFEKRPVIVGMGPAGLFAALRLTEYGLKPLILERGKKIKERVKDVERFWKERVLNAESNVQFGEGGAGTFSDGKLTTRVDDSRISYILQSFVDAGAESKILYEAKPHIGTDRLRSVVIALRKLLLERGCEVRFNARVTGFNQHKGKIESIIVNDGEEISSDHFILAIGHSARDTYETLHQCGVEVASKSFAIGVRVEHPQSMIDKIQYGDCAGHPKLPAAEYVVTHNLKDKGRSAYSFCMCPGGLVVNASSEPGRLVINGMSLSGRGSGYANSALIVTVTPEDFGEGPLASIAFQRRWEEAAFKSGGNNYNAPAQNLMSFIGEGKVLPLNSSSYLPALTDADLGQCLPHYVINTLRSAIPVFGRKMKGFISKEATLIGVETRTSAPVRITRGLDFQSISVASLYPCGEGAGYAGGIMSSALDGIKVADEIAGSLKR